MTTPNTDLAEQIAEANWKHTGGPSVIPSASSAAPDRRSDDHHREARLGGWTRRASGGPVMRAERQLAPDHVWGGARFVVLIATIGRMYPWTTHN